MPSREKALFLRIQQPFVFWSVYYVLLFDPNQIKVLSFHSKNLALHTDLN